MQRAQTFRVFPHPTRKPISDLLLVNSSNREHIGEAFGNTAA